MYFTVSVSTVIRVISVISSHKYPLILYAAQEAAYVDYSRNTSTSDADTFPASQGCGLICANFDCWLMPSHLLSFVGGHRMVAGDYYSILIKRMMERLEGTGRDIISPFPSFHFHWAYVPNASFVNISLGDKRQLGTIKSALTVHLPWAHPEQQALFE